MIRKVLAHTTGPAVPAKHVFKAILRRLQQRDLRLPYGRYILVKKMDFNNVVCGYVSTFSPTGYFHANANSLFASVNKGVPARMCSGSYAPIRRNRVTRPSERACGS
jgi:hypothetical protein